jgi:hypothetical protein
MKNTLFLIIVLSLVASAYSQEIPKSMIENPRVKRPLGLSISLGGPTYVISAALDCFVLPVFNIEAGGGILGYYAGAKYHFNGNAKRDKTTLYAGVLFNTILPSETIGWSFGPSGGDWKTTPQTTRYGVYLPVGLNTIRRNGYTFSFEIAYSSINREFTGFPLYCSVKFGYHFSKPTH